MHVQPTLDSLAWAQLQFQLAPGAGWGDNVQVRPRNRTASQIAGPFGSSIREFAGFPHRVQATAGRPGAKTLPRFNAVCSAPCREGVRWQQAMLRPPAESHSCLRTSVPWKWHCLLLWHSILWQRGCWHMAPRGGFISPTLPITAMSYREGCSHMLWSDKSPEVCTGDVV